MPKALAPEQVEQFIQRGYVKVEQAYSEKQALAVQDFLWGKLEPRGVRREDRSTWTKPMVHLQEGYADPVFQACLTQRLCDAVEDLVGPDRWRDRDDRQGLWGWWPVNFALGADKPWTVPSGGWHWDGIHFKHRVDSPDQGLLLLCNFSRIRSRGGGTLVAEGSHQVVARFLAKQSEGINVQEGIDQLNAAHPWLRDLTTASSEDAESRMARFMKQATTDADGTRLRVVETTADPGDIYLCHPFLYHAASPNHSGVPRFMCNRTTPLKEPMNFDRPDRDYSPLERSIRAALGMA